MKFNAWLQKGALRVAFPLLLLASLLAPAAVGAAGGIAISGSFYTQAFQIPQGASVSGPSIYVVVFNNGTEELKVRMTKQSPLGVNIVLSHTDFTIPPAGQQQVLVGVEVSKDAAPGDYEISVTAESYRENAGGIQIAGAAGQSAKLTVLGESAQVTVRAVNPEGQPIVATVRLYRVASGKSLEVAFNETGVLDVKVAPGSFLANSYVGGEKVAEESFTVAANDKKIVNLSGATVFIEGFGIVPNYLKDGGKLAFVQVVYTVRNVYQRVAKGEVILNVTRDGGALEELSLANLSPLEMGRVGLNYNYIPAGGWGDGNYAFKLQLKLDGKPYTASLAEQLKVSGGVAAAGGTVPGGTVPVGTVPAPSGGGDGAWMYAAIIGGSGLLVIVALLIFLLLRRR